ncbi:MAG: biopolymer transporter ExbD [Verrucomicrobia bacterium]|nr:biopolymer transporter ExbD [Verrucomicrobiota bacterium]
MRRFSQRQQLHTLSEINVTPLLDLAFVLLVIFMITTPLLENSIDLAVPTSATASGAVDVTKVNVISIDRFAAVKLDGRPLDGGAAALDEPLRALKREKGDALTIVVRAHKELPVQQFVGVMDALQRVQISKVGVVTQNDNEQPAAAGGAP